MYTLVHLLYYISFHFSAVSVRPAPSLLPRPKYLILFGNARRAMRIYIDSSEPNRPGDPPWRSAESPARLSRMASGAMLKKSPKACGLTEKKKDKKYTVSTSPERRVIRERFDCSRICSFEASLHQSAFPPRGYSGLGGILSSVPECASPREVGKSWLGHQETTCDLLKKVYTALISSRRTVCTLSPRIRFPTLWTSRRFAIPAAPTAPRRPRVHAQRIRSKARTLLNSSPEKQVNF